MSFIIQLKDVEVEFNDIIELSKEQQDHILKSAENKTFLEWTNSKKGIKILLNFDQCNRVLLEKNSLVSGKDAKKMLKSKTIIFSSHASERIAVRVDKLPNGQPPTLDSMLLVISLIIESDVVDTQAEWKGFKNLAYTLLNTHLGERFKITISFEFIGKELIKVITVSNEHIDKLTRNLVDDPHIKVKLEQLKNQLFND